MEVLINFGMKNSLLLHSLAYKIFNSLGDTSDKALYTYTDTFMRNFARNANKGDKCNAFDQHYKAKLSDEVFNNISQDLDVEGNVCDIPDEYFQYVKKYEKKSKINKIHNLKIIVILIKMK